MNARPTQNTVQNTRLGTSLGDEPALSIRSSEGEMPQSREVSVRWLLGAVMTGVTSVLLMGAALYIAFDGKQTFSTSYESLSVSITGQSNQSAGRSGKADRLRPVVKARADREIVEASIRERVGDSDRIRKQPFTRIAATLATSATSLTADVPAFNPIELLTRNLPRTASPDENVSTSIYGAEVEGEVAVRLYPLDLSASPKVNLINDQNAAKFVKASLEGAFAGSDTALGFASATSTITEIEDLGQGGIIGIADNVVSVPKSSGGALQRSERIVTIKSPGVLEEILLKNGFTSAKIVSIQKALGNQLTTLSSGTRLRILFGSDRNGETQIPYRLSIYRDDQHAATLALADTDQYVVAQAPPAIEFKDDNTEQINVDALPSIYRSIYETGRKQDVPDELIERIVAMFAFDLDLTRKITPGDSINLLQTVPRPGFDPELLYVGLEIGNQSRKFYRFRTSEDGVVDFYDANGQTGKKFLMRRPVKDGGRLRSRFGNRKHPIFKTYRLHAGIDLSAPTGTPIYAAGDGVIGRAQWVSGYGRFISVKHSNGYETAYAHQSRFAKGIKPGVRVRQGQVIGYVGSTGYSTGPHLHYEIRINGRPQDPLKIRLPRDRSLPNQYARTFEDTIKQVDDLMARDPKDTVVASLQK